MSDLDIGTKIAKLRKERGFTQKDLAEFLGVTDKAVSRWESGAGNPDITLLPKLAKLLGVSTDYLLSVQSSQPVSSDQVSIRSDDGGKKPTRVISTLAKVFAVLGPIFRCAFLFMMTYTNRHTSIWPVYYAVGNALLIIDAILCVVTFATLDKATSKRQLIRLGFLNLIFCSVPSGVFLFTVPSRELHDPKTIQESDETLHAKEKFIGALIVIGVGVALIITSIICFSMPFFEKKGNHPAVTGYQVLFDYAHCYYYAEGSSGWLLFAFFGELLMLLFAMVGAAYWISHAVRRTPRKASFKSIVFIGSSFMVLGWVFGILIANCDAYTLYKANGISSTSGVTFATTFCIIGSNLCGIGFMIPLRKIKRVSLGDSNEY